MLKLDMFLQLSKVTHQNIVKTSSIKGGAIFMDQLYNVGVDSS